MPSRGNARKARRASPLAAPFAALLILAAMSSMLSAQTKGPRLVVPASKAVSNSLTLITPSQSNFDSVLESYFPGILDGVSDFQATRPYLVMIRNDTRIPAVAYVIQWKVSYQNGTSQTFTSTSILIPLANRADVTLMPGRVRLVSPSFNVTPQQYRPGSLTGWLSQASLVSPPPVGIASSVPEIAGVVWSGGDYSGPQGWQVWRLWAVARFAAMDEARYVMRALGSSTPLPTLYGNLDQQYMRGQQYMGPTDMDAYISDRGSCALLAITLLQNASRAEAMSRLVLAGGSGTTPFTVFGKVYDRLFNTGSGSASPPDAQ